MSDKYSDVDGDSLFGSPPPSPTRGRSPLLALPSLSTSSAHENVGTIALPGSHNISKLPVNLPAWPSSSQTNLEPPRRHSLQATPLPRVTPAPRPVKQKKARSTFSSSTPRPEPPPITLPPPEEPLPANFLRNQQALLGLAGLVGGVNPANLSHGGRQGATAKNPIVVDDEAPAPPSSFSWTSRLPRVDPTQLPTPSSEEIVSALVNQKNIFPVLKNLLSLLGIEAGCQTAPPTRKGSSERPTSDSTHSDRRSQLSVPPLKRRKINHVPAGAADWDVPYPFSQSEGPSDYRTNWEKERGKRLITQLVSLVKEAVHKAATKTYVQKRKKEWLEAEEAMNHYRPEVADYGIDDPRSTLRFNDAQNTHATSESNPTQCTPFDQLIASLLAAQSTGSGMLLPNSGTTPSIPETDGPTSESYQTEFENLLADIKICSTNDDISAWSMTDYTMTATNSPTLTSSTRLPTPFESNKENVGPELATLTCTSPPNSDFDFGFPIDPVLLESSTRDTPKNVPVDTAPTASTSVPAHYNLLDSPLPLPDAGMTDGNSEMPVAATSPTCNFHPSPPQPPLPTPFLPTAFPYSFGNPPNMPFIGYLTPGPTAVNPLDTFQRQSGSTSAPPKHAVTVTQTTTHLDRQEILRKAKVRRDQLVAEIARAKVELWETTIEQGVLVNLTKDSELS